MPSVILMGSKPGSVLALKILLSRKWNVLSVVVTPQQDLSWVQSPTLEEYAKSQNISVLTQDELSPDKEVDFVISYMYRKLVRPCTLKIAKRAALNFHAGPLPEFGGWAFYNVAILENSPHYGCTCHYMDEGFDTGDILKVMRFPINPEKETAFSLERKAQIKMIKLFKEFCELAEKKKKLPRTPQNKSKQRYFNKENFQKLKLIPLNASYKAQQKIARAFWYPPYECAHILFNGKKLEIIPDIVKKEVAEALHQNDFDILEDDLNNKK